MLKKLVVKVLSLLENHVSHEHARLSNAAISYEKNLECKIAIQLTGPMSCFRCCSFPFFVEGLLFGILFEIEESAWDSKTKNLFEKFKN